MPPQAYSKFMPYQIWTQDQRPQIIMAGAQGLAQGLDRALAGVGTGLQAYLKGRMEAAELRASLAADEQDVQFLPGGDGNSPEGLPLSAGGGIMQDMPNRARGQGADGGDADQFKGPAQQAKALRDYNHTAFGLPKDQLAAMGLAELRGTMRRMELKSVMEERRQNQLFKQAQIRGLDDSLRGAQAQRENAGRFPSWAQGMSERGTAPGDVPFDATPEEFNRRTSPMDGRAAFEEMLRSGFNPGNETDSLLKSIQGMNEGAGVNWENVKPREGSTSDGRSYIYGKGGQFQILPDMNNGGEDSERTLSDGSQVFWNGQRWVAAPRARADTGSVTDKDRHRALTAEINALTSASAFPGKTGEQARARIEELKKERDALGGSRSPQGGGQGDGPAASQYQKGQRAIQNGVTYEFDGQNWNPAAR